MNKTQRQGFFFIAIFVVIFTGGLLLKWTTFQSIIALSFMAIVMKLTDIEDTIAGLK